MSSYASRIAVPPLTVYASTKYAVEGLSDGLRRELLPWGIKVTRVHPSGVKGTEFNQRAARDGGIRYRSLPIGKITREHLARELVKLVERPRRELFLSRLYDVPVFINRRFPGLVDFVMALWVRLKRDELSVIEWGGREGRAEGTTVAGLAKRGRWALPAGLLALAGTLLIRSVRDK
jgi:NAD(P)-dependent dehydrogenase (short-subunit alcohol dehydrogenase family)